MAFSCYLNSLFVLGHVHRFDIFAAEVGGSPGRSWEEGRALGEARGEGGDRATLRRQETLGYPL